MKLFTPMKKSSDTETENNLPVISQRELKNFLEAEKNTLDHMKSFITLSFLLNTGCLGAVFKFRPDLTFVIYTLSIGTLMSMTLFMISVKFLNSSMEFIYNKNYIHFIRKRKKVYFCSYLGIFILIFSFEISLFYYIFINEHIIQ